MKRWPIVRHLRWLYWWWQVERGWRIWVELGLPLLDRSVDRAMLDDIWNGEDT
jgi:hypothetical protein